jgi:hypothetical protein
MRDDEPGNKGNVGKDIHLVSSIPRNPPGIARWSMADGMLVQADTSIWGNVLPIKSAK